MEQVTQPTGRVDRSWGQRAREQAPRLLRCYTIGPENAASMWATIAIAQPRSWEF